MNSSAHPVPLRALLVDPSLFTGPYDAALTTGLKSAGVDAIWATRPTRPGDRQEIPRELTDPFFYKHADRMTWLPGPLRALSKGLAHALGMARLLARVWRTKPDIVHVQWVVIPPLDVLVFWWIRRQCKLVLTVHDTVPFNGEHMSLLQNLGFDLPVRLADAVVVHTRAGKQRLVDRGMDPEKITVIPHGPLPLAAQPDPARPPRDPRWTFVAFGEIKPYKGLDVLVEALALLAPDTLSACRLVIAGRPRMDLTPLMQRISDLKLGSVIDLRPQRQTEAQMADLFADADCFVFPYRQIDASGVYYLVLGFQKWLIASDVGVFKESIAQDAGGSLVPAGDPHALARALEAAITQRLRPASGAQAATWNDIGAATRAVYEAGLRSGRQVASLNPS